MSASPPHANGIAAHEEEDTTVERTVKATNKNIGKSFKSFDQTVENNEHLEDNGDSRELEKDAPPHISKGSDSFVKEKAADNDSNVDLPETIGDDINITANNNNNNNTNNSNGNSNHEVSGENDDPDKDCVIATSTSTNANNREIGAGDADMLVDCDDGDVTTSTTKLDENSESPQTAELIETTDVDEESPQTNGHLGDLSDSTSPPPPSADGLSSSCSPPLLPAPTAAIPPGHYPYHHHHHHPHHPHQHPHHAHHHHHHHHHHQQHPAATGYYLGTTSPSSNSPSSGGAVSPPVVAGSAPILQQPASPPGSYPSSSSASHSGGSGTHSRGDSPGDGGGSPTSGGQHVVHVHVNPGETFSVRLGDQMQHIQGEYMYTDLHLSCPSTQILLSPPVITFCVICVCVYEQLKLLFISSHSVLSHTIFVSPKALRYG